MLATPSVSGHLRCADGPAKLVRTPTCRARDRGAATTTPSAYGRSAGAPPICARDARRTSPFRVVRANAMNTDPFSEVESTLALVARALTDGDDAPRRSRRRVRRSSARRGGSRAHGELIRAIPGPDRPRYGQEVNRLPRTEKPESCSISGLAEIGRPATPVAARVDLTFPDATAKSARCTRSRASPAKSCACSTRSVSRRRTARRSRTSITTSSPSTFRRSPGRDELDNFYVDDERLLRSQTVDGADPRDGDAHAAAPDHLARPRLSPRHGRCDALVHVPSDRRAGGRPAG